MNGEKAGGQVAHRTSSIQEGRKRGIERLETWLGVGRRLSGQDLGSYKKTLGLVLKATGAIEEF